MAHKSQYITILNLPLGRLPTSLVDVGLLRFLPQPRSAVRVLFAHGLSVGQVLCAVAHHDQRANLRPINSHVGEDTGSIWDLLLLSGGHRGMVTGECLVYTLERERV
jgi:hypothetical protein